MSPSASSNFEGLGNLYFALREHARVCLLLLHLILNDCVYMNNNDMNLQFLELVLRITDCECLLVFHLLDCGYIRNNDKNLLSPSTSTSQNESARVS
jgi:hypothetical protein